MAIDGFAPRDKYVSIYNYDPDHSATSIQGVTMYRPSYAALQIKLDQAYNDVMAVRVSNSCVSHHHLLLPCN